jgi:coiled-coil domain-containing protein 55
MKVSFSLAKKPETPSPFQLKKPSVPVPTQKPSLFSADDDDGDDEDSLVLDSKTNKKNGIAIQTVSAETSKAQKKRELAEMAVDSTVYQYDEVWDKIQGRNKRSRKLRWLNLRNARSARSRYLSVPSECATDVSFRSLSTSRDCSPPLAHGNLTAS